MELSDNELLIIQINEGSERAFKQLFDLYASDVKSYAFYILRNSEDAEDIVQELFMELWKRKGRLRIRGDLRTYLISATYNRSITKSERNQRQARKKQRYAEDVDPFGVDLIPFDRESERMEQIREVLKRVPKKSREAFEMIRLHQLSFKEAAAKTGVTEATIKSHVQNAENHIRNELLGSRKKRGGSKKILILFIYFLSQSCL
ncbi:sigma-70 family RNA polymerase sigma factor [Chitinophaga filiformis]|uniref:RNA polymerase sigma factor n=1 Tax=Chitinophaga filiformis TaxID=104663 RepID=UPI001F385B9C|nr:sigma-70 family RNA polymerase sigma factor [Chitinophaga filiformis]MCF6405088.1 sigma-70 family RNA polymerase sigma factor [Chitinophaga filiformis]